MNSRRLRYVDRIVCLQRGKIVEQGTPAELALSDGYFADMVGRETELVRNLVREPPLTLTVQGTSVLSHK